MSRYEEVNRAFEELMQLWYRMQLNGSRVREKLVQTRIDLIGICTDDLERLRVHYAMNIILTNMSKYTEIPERGRLVHKARCIVMHALSAYKGRDVLTKDDLADVSTQIENRVLPR